jgi:hypothetical protein
MPMEPSFSTMKNATRATVTCISDMIRQCAPLRGAQPQSVYFGHPARAMHRHGEAITLARRLQDPPSLAHSIFLSCASSQAPGGNAAAVFAAAKELWELSAQLGFSQFQACAQMFLGWALARSGEALQGIAQTSEGLGILQRIGASMFMPRAGCLMADAHLMAHRYREGLGHVAQALHFTETGDQSCLALLYHLRAELLLHLHGTGDAAVEASLRQAIAVARRQEAKGWELPATTSLARLWEKPETSSPRSTGVSPRASILLICRRPGHLLDA